MATYQVALSSTRITPLILPERSFGFTTRYYIPYSDIAVASATGNSDVIVVTLGTTPTNWMVQSAYAYVSTAFAGTTALTMTVGTTSTANAFLASTTVETAGTIIPTNGPYSVNSPSNAVGTAAVSLTATFTNATGGSPSALTAGAVEILLQVVDPGAVS